SGISLPPGLETRDYNPQCGPSPPAPLNMSSTTASATCHHFSGLFARMSRNVDEIANEQWQRKKNDVRLITSRDESEVLTAADKERILVPTIHEPTNGGTCSWLQCPLSERCRRCYQHGPMTSGE